MNGRTKIAPAGKVSDYIPNPTFDQSAARPGAQEEVLQGRQPRREEPPGHLQRVVRTDATPGDAGARAALPRFMDEQASTAVMSTLASLVGGAPARRPRRHPRHRPRPQPVDARAVDLQLPGPHLRHARDHPAGKRWRRPRPSSTGCRARRPRSS
ncbi:MAG: hypothetical protein R2711_17205 [Acidimicrobiales bacterium]